MPPIPSDPLAPARLCRQYSGQLSTFDRGTSKKIPLPPGQRATLGQVEGQGYIAQLWLTFPGWFWQHWAPDEPTSPAILKNLILRLYWDGAQEPAVEAPVADFFALGLCRIANYTARYIGMSSGGFYCRFPMPFAKGFRLEMENRDPHLDTRVYANALYQLTDSPNQEAGYFHAHFQSGENDGPDPLSVAQVQGRGHYAGCTLALQAQARSYLDFLEAPEYLFLDEDWDRARIVGTGLEDYFMGGWYFREGCFQGELHGLTVKDPLDSAVSMYRLHEADAVHFQRRFRMEFTNPFQPPGRPFRHASVAFFYLDAPQGQCPPLPAAAELLHWYRLHDIDHQSYP